MQEYQAILQQEKEARAKILNVSMVAVVGAMVVAHSVVVSALFVGYRPVIVKRTVIGSKGGW